MHTKNAEKSAFLFCQNVLELRSKPCFKELFVKSSLKIRKNFLSNTPLHFGEAFEVTLSVSHGGQPQLIMHTKRHNGDFSAKILYLIEIILYLLRQTYESIQEKVRKAARAFYREDEVRTFSPRSAFMNIHKQKERQ